MSIKLPVDQRRTTLSVVAQLVTTYAQMAENCKSVRPNTNTKFVTKEDATETIQWSTDFFKDKLDRYFDVEEEKKIATKIDLIISGTVSQLNEKLVEFDLYDKLAFIFNETFRQVLFENPFVVSQPNHVLSGEDFEIAEQSHYNEYLSNKRVSYCHDFAFYQLNEEKAFPYIFNPKASLWGDDIVVNSVNYLSKWGYERVEKPSFGDLVLYSHEGEARHWGIWMHEGNVLSKLGMMWVVKHPVGDVVLSYGDDVSFFHKKIKSSFLDGFIKELEQASQSVGDFSHIAVASPLNARGCLKKIIEILKFMPIAKVFKNSIYNIAYNEKLKGKILLNLKKYSINIHHLQHKDRVIDTIKQMALTVQERLESKLSDKWR